MDTTKKRGIIKKVGLSLILATQLNASGYPVFDAALLTETIRENARVALQDGITFQWNAGLRIFEFYEKVKDTIYGSLGGYGPGARRIVEKCLPDLNIPGFDLGIDLSKYLGCGAGELAKMAGLDQYLNMQGSILEMLGVKNKDVSSAPRRERSKEYNRYIENKQRTSSTIQTSDTTLRKKSGNTGIDLQGGDKPSQIQKDEEAIVNNNKGNIANDDARTIATKANTSPYTTPNRCMPDDKTDDIQSILSEKDPGKQLREKLIWEQKTGKDFDCIVENSELFANLKSEKEVMGGKLYIIPTQKVPEGENGKPKLGLSLSGHHPEQYKKAKEAYEEQVNELKRAIKNLEKEGSKVSLAKGGSKDTKGLDVLTNLVKNGDGLTNLNSAILAYYQGNTAMATAAAEGVRNAKKEDGIEKISDSQKMSMDISRTQAILTQLLILNQNVSDLTNVLVSLLTQLSTEQRNNFTKLQNDVNKVQLEIEKLHVPLELIIKSRN